MHTPEHTIGIVGLGRMGGQLALQAVEKDITVIGYDPGNVTAEISASAIIRIDTLAAFREHLTPPRAIFLYVPAGPIIDQTIDKLIPHLDAHDSIIDGGNSYWGDSIRRYQRLQAENIDFIDLGTSGGIAGARSGACFMAGGEQEAVARIEPVLRKLAVTDGYVYAGPAGSGHFVKLVHNGIEFGMLQAIGEGVDLLSHYADDLDIPAILHCWRHGSVIRSWLLDLMEEIYHAQGGLEQIPPHIEDTGEVNWLVTDALHMEVAIPVITQSVLQLLASRDNTRNWARAIAMMRHGFGGHPFGPHPSIAQSRQTERVGDYIRPDRSDQAETEH
ncbi:MAG: decarboxylating 6-phosphogluconate dehydrogenase [Chloroflexaceae bacterium]|nr:decarboxylating 6-phosphogluconate dehydrogenase [Chloroflexaceae bacterium]